jgi:hypothetical protein
MMDVELWMLLNRELQAQSRLCRAGMGGRGRLLSILSIRFIVMFKLKESYNLVFLIYRIKKNK